MRTIRLFILTLLIGVASVLVAPQQAQAAQYPTYSLRVCNIYNTLSGKAWFCLKIYVKRQEDGTGTVLKDRHVYAHTEGQGQDDCGSAIQNPATNRTIVSVDNAAGDVMERNYNVQLNDDMHCSFRWASNINSQGTVVTWYYTPNLSIFGSGDEDQDFLQLKFFTNGEMKCYASRDVQGGHDCAFDGPFWPV